MKSSKKQEKFDITKFEKLANERGELNGGYSTSEMGGTLWDSIKKILTGGGVDIDINTGNTKNTSCTVNNCHGGNCVSGCGATVN